MHLAVTFASAYSPSLLNKILKNDRDNGQTHSYLACTDPENFLRGGHLPTRGGPTNFNIAKPHILEIRGGTEPPIPLWIRHALSVYANNFEAKSC